jgi:RimJ/RimL family protein N-acetyltransferase
MSQIPDIYLRFWSKAFNLTYEDLTSPGFSIVTDGNYVEKHQEKYVFFYFDPKNKKCILACSKNNLGEIRNSMALTKLDSLNIENIRNEAYFKKLNLAFKDIDYGLLSFSDFTPIDSDAFDIRSLQKNETSEIDDFYLSCSDDDKNTLDLTFDNDVALGIYVDSRLLGIARYTPIRDTSIADITVLVQEEVRGKGYSTPLVSSLVRKILENELQPKHRVEENNTASIAIAKGLGFTPLFRLLTWEVPNT